MNMETKNEIKDVPYVVHEATVERYERKEKRNHIVTLILIIALIITNCGWLYAWNQYEYVDDYSVEEVSIDGHDGNAIYQNGEGNIVDGEGEEAHN